MAAQGKDLLQVSITMLLFGLGAAAPLLLLGLLSREVWMRLRDRVLATGKVAKTAFGMLLIVIGMAIVSGIDRKIEAILVDASPQWLTDLTTNF